MATGATLQRRHATPGQLVDIGIVLALALLWRTLFFNGAFGSDDGTYFNRALDVASGTWATSNYNGALRYGFNIPAGLLVRLFGTSLAVANLWPLLCSLAEVGLVAWLARDLAGRRAGLVAGLLLGAAPLHIAVATRIHADPVVSFFLSAAFVAVYAGLKQRSAAVCFIAGLALGGVYWSKELAAVTYLAFLPLLGYFRSRWRLLPWVFAGLALMLALNGALLQWVAGDPLHTARVVLGALGRSFIDGGQGEDHPAYYLRYLFADPRHVGLLGYLAVAGVWACWPGRPTRGWPGAGFVVVWLLGLLLVLSLFPVSLSPLRFTMKQSNYISLFLAPLAILAALALASLPPRAATTLLALTLALGLLFGALQQADYRAFTGNSKALDRLAQSQQATLWVGSSNNDSLGSLLARVDGRASPWVSFRDARNEPEALRQRAASTSRVLAVLDPQTALWFAGPEPVTAPRSCWEALQTVAPIDLGLGNRFAAGLADVAARLPLASAQRLAAAAERLAHPLPATVYSVRGDDVRCPGG